MPSTIQQMFLIKLMPPSNSGGVPSLAKLSPASKIFDPSRLPPTDRSPSTAFDPADVMDLNAGDSLDFYIVRNAGVCEFIILPLSWIGGCGGGGGGFRLGDDHTGYFDEMHLSYPPVPPNQPLVTCDLASFSYLGSGHLKWEIKGGTFTLDLNLEEYSQGACVGVCLRDSKSSATVLFKDTRCALQRLEVP